MKFYIVSLFFSHFHPSPKALGSAQWIRRIASASPACCEEQSLDATLSPAMQHQHNLNSHPCDTFDHIVLLDIPSRTLSFLICRPSCTASPPSMETAFYSLLICPQTLQDGMEEVMEYDSMLTFASEFADALRGTGTLTIDFSKEPMRGAVSGGITSEEGKGDGRGEEGVVGDEDEGGLTGSEKTGGRQAARARPGSDEGKTRRGSEGRARMRLVFREVGEEMSLSLPCVEEGLSPGLFRAFLPFFHFDPATGLGRQPLAEEAGGGDGKEREERKGEREEREAGTPMKRRKIKVWREGGGRRGGGQRSLIHPGLMVRPTMTGSKWEEDEGDGREDAGAGGKEEKWGQIREDEGNG